ncbi:MAG: lipocalin-like domain-containing protein [Simplicispira sp.]|nr:lipocalin-like domain-containing protein [Simplicispira sp.]
MKKLTFCLRRLPELSSEEFHLYWRVHHAPLVVARAKVLGIRRYVQVRTERNDKLHERLQVRNGGSPAAFDGIAELWYDDDWPLGVRSEDARQAAVELLEDERNFIDLKSSPMTMGRELSVIAFPAGVSKSTWHSPPSQLVGLWILSRWEVTYDDGRPPRHPFGEDAIRQLIYTEDGQMSVTVVRSTRARLGSDSIRQASMSQMAAAFESMFHYVGSYEPREGVVVHHVSMSSNPNLVGTTQFRHASLLGDMLVLSPKQNETKSSEGCHTLTWRKAR